MHLYKHATTAEFYMVARIMSSYTMAALMVLLLMLAGPLITSMTAADVYYVTADEQSCPSNQTCHNLSYYISQPESYFTSNTAFLFLEGEHSFDSVYHINITGVSNLTLQGQGQWPVAGAEETVMQSTVIINCTRGRGGFYFFNSYNVTIEGLTVVNCGGLDNSNAAVFRFSLGQTMNFNNNSIQHMTGYGLYVLNSDFVTVTSCSFYHSAVCNITLEASPEYGGGMCIMYTGFRPRQSSSLRLHVSVQNSNMTRCCNYIGGGLLVQTKYIFDYLRMGFNNLIFSHNKARMGGGLAVILYGKAHDVTVSIVSCYFRNGSQTEDEGAGGMYFHVQFQSSIQIYNTILSENYGPTVSELYVACDNVFSQFTMILKNMTIISTQSFSNYGVSITNCPHRIQFTNSQMTFANLFVAGLYQGIAPFKAPLPLHIDSCQFEGSHNVPSILYLSLASIRNCTFSKNTGGDSVITISQSSVSKVESTFTNCSITDNNMTGLTLIAIGAKFVGQNVIQNNRNTKGAGITLLLPGYIKVEGQLHLYNNTASKHGGAIFVMQPLIFFLQSKREITCSLEFLENSSSIVFSGNRARKGGDDIYGGILMGCYTKELHMYIPHVDNASNTSAYYFETPLLKYLHFSKTDRLSSLSSDPIMVCFCNSSNIPDCSNRSQHHIKTYPGLEISKSIATVGYYGGISPSFVQVNSKYANVVRFYNNHETSCFPLHILLRNTSSTTALVDISVDGGLQDWGVSIRVDIVECPVGFAQDKVSGQCHCEQFLANNNVQCNMSVTPFTFLRSGNSWFGYINNTQQCITGTTNCPFDYCNRSNVSFDIMAPDSQCVTNRTGILCGQCPSNLSIMLGSNHCGTCSNWYLFLLPVFALAGIMLVAVLMFLNLSVSVGTINGLLFYANIVKLNETFFFPNGSVPVVSQFISWLNLDLGIEMCLFDGLDGYWNTWLQFAFPSYLFLLMGCIIFGCRYSVWLCRLCGSNAVPALATLFLMSYTKILLTVTNALSMSRLPCNNGILTVWSVDGNIEYGSDKHLVLSLFSSGVLVIGLAYPVLLLCTPLLERYSHKCIPHRWNPVTKFKPLFDAYGGPYKDKYRFWTGVTLILRLIVTVTFSFTSGTVAYINTTMVMVIFTFWFFTNGVYNKIYLSTLEAFYLLNIFLLSIVTLATVNVSPSALQIATIVSVSLSFCVCLATMAMHFWWNFDINKIKRRLGFEDRLEYTPVSQVAADLDSNKKSRPLESSSSMVYGSRRGEHQFLLQFPRLHTGQATRSPVLLAREPLLDLDQS